MEINKLYPFVLLIVLVGMIIGVGIITADKFGSSTYYTRVAYNDTLATTNYSAQGMDKGNLTLIAVWNGTSNTLNSVCYTVNATPGRFMYLNTSNGDGGVGCSAQGVANAIYAIYDYKDYDTATTAAMASVSTEISNIASQWLGLIVTVIVLSIILFLVIRSFGAAGGGRRD